MTKLSKDGTRLAGKGAPTQAPVIPLIPRWVSNMLVGITTLTTGALCTAVVVLLIKHFKMKAMMASLVIASLPPPLPGMPIVPYFEHIHGITKDCLDIMNTDPTSKIEDFTFRYKQEPEKLTSWTELLDKCFAELREAYTMQWRHHPGYEIIQDINHTYNKINRDDKNDLMSLPLKKNKPPRVICSYPKITMWTNVLGTGGFDLCSV